MFHLLMPALVLAVLMGQPPSTAVTSSDLPGPKAAQAPNTAPAATFESSAGAAPSVPPPAAPKKAAPRASGRAKAPKSATPDAASSPLPEIPANAAATPQPRQPSAQPPTPPATPPP